MWLLRPREDADRARAGHRGRLLRRRPRSSAPRTTAAASGCCCSPGSAPRAWCWWRSRSGPAARGARALERLGAGRSLGAAAAGAGLSLALALVALPAERLGARALGRRRALDPVARRLARRRRQVGGDRRRFCRRRRRAADGAGAPLRRAAGGSPERGARGRLGRLLAGWRRSCSRRCSTASSRCRRAAAARRGARARRARRGRHRRGLPGRREPALDGAQRLRRRARADQAGRALRQPARRRRAARAALGRRPRARPRRATTTSRAGSPSSRSSRRSGCSSRARWRRASPSGRGVDPGSPAALPAYVLGLGPRLASCSTIPGNQLSREVEASADEFALELTDDPQGADRPAAAADGDERLRPRPARDRHASCSAPTRRRSSGSAPRSPTSRSALGLTSVAGTSRP